MTPADVPNEWLDIFEAGIDDFDGPDRDGYRRGLAAVLPLYATRLQAQQGTPRVQYGVRYPGWPTVSEASSQEEARAWVEEYAALDSGNGFARVQCRTVAVTRNATGWEDVDG